MTKFGYLFAPVVLFAMAISANAQDGKNLGTNAENSKDVISFDVWGHAAVGYSYSDRGVSTVDNNDSEFFQAFTLGFAIGFNDSISGNVSLTTGDRYTEMSDGSFGDDIEFDIFNVTFTDAFTEGLTVIFGSAHRTFGLDSDNLWYNPRLQGDDPNEDDEARNTGLFMDYVGDNMTVGFGWSKMDDDDLGNGESADDSHVMLDLTYGLDSVSEGSAVAIAILYNNRPADINVITFMVDSHWAGLVDGLDIGLGVGINSGDDHSGMRVRLGLNYDLGMDNGAWVGFNMIYATGNEEPGDEWEGYQTATGAMNFNIINSTNGIGRTTQTNVTSFAIGGGMSFDMGSGKNNATLSLLIGMADQTEGDNSYGTEIDINFDHTLNSNVAWGAHVAYLSSSDVYGADGGVEDSEYQIIFPVTFSF